MLQAFEGVEDFLSIKALTCNIDMWIGMGRPVKRQFSVCCDRKHVVCISSQLESLEKMYLYTSLHSSVSHLPQSDGKRAREESSMVGKAEGEAQKSFVTHMVIISVASMQIF